MATAYLAFLPAPVVEFIQGHETAVYATAIALVVVLIAAIYQRYDTTTATEKGSVPVLPGVFSSIGNTGAKADVYTDLHYAASVEDRKARAQEMTNYYYDLVTSFYEYGWGQSFHFAPRFRGETFNESIARHEYQLASRVGLKPDMMVLDVGCGVGGPLRNIARFSGSKIVGITINEEQVHRGTLKAAREGLGDRVSLVQGDFLDMPFKTASFDAAFSIEATCHAPERAAVFAEVIRCLKPGAVFGSYEWVVTDSYNANDAWHREIKKGVEAGDSLPDLVTTKDVVDALEAVGFEVEEVEDLAVHNYNGAELPWYAPFIPEYTLANFKSTPLGIGLTHIAVTVMEFLRLAPRGTVSIHTHLRTAAKYLRAGGELGIFTPMLFVKARKPMNWKPVAQSAAAAKEEPAARATPNSGRGRRGSAVAK